MVYTVGVLMHQPPKQVNKVMSEMVRVSKKWLVCSELIHYKKFYVWDYNYKEKWEQLGCTIHKSVLNPYPLPAIHWWKTLLYTVAIKEGNGK